MRTAVAVFAGLALLAPGSAEAGGWWSHVDVRPSMVAAGQRVVLREHVTFEVVPRTSGPFFVYLLRGLDDAFFTRAIEQPRRWSLGDVEPIRVGRVRVRHSALAAEAQATFRAPALAPGEYGVAFCAAGCRRPLGDTLPGILSVVTTADLALRVERLDRRIDQQADALRRSRVTYELLQAGVRDLRQQLAVEPDAGVRRWYVGSSAAIALAGAALLAAVAALVLRRRHQGQTPAVAATDAVLRDETVPEDEQFRSKGRGGRTGVRTVRGAGLPAQPPSAVADRERGSAAPAVSGRRSRRHPASRS